MHEINPETELAIAHSPRDAQPAMRGLWALDFRLGELVRAAREPMLGEIRLTWWRDALSALGKADVPAEPLLRDMAMLAERHDLDTDLLATIADGWIELLAPFPVPDDALLAFAGARGGALFRTAGHILGADLFDPLQMAGQGWSLIDFACHCSDADTARRALLLALPMLETAFATRWPKQARPLGMIATLALRDARAGGPPARRGSPARQFAMLRHRLTGC